MKRCLALLSALSLCLSLACGDPGDDSDPETADSSDALDEKASPEAAALTCPSGGQCSKNPHPGGDVSGLILTCPSGGSCTGPVHPGSDVSALIVTCPSGSNCTTTPHPGGASTAQPVQPTR